MELFNVTTRRKDSIDDPAALQQAILSGSHAFSQGSSVVVKSPDGQMGTIPAENVVDAIRAGYQVETNSQRAVREYVDENQGILGSLKVGLGQFADEAALGLPELIYNKTADPLEVAKKEALKKEHSLANTLGGLSGFGASMFLGGPLWKAGTKAGEKVGAHIAQKLAAEAGEQTVKQSFRKAGANIAGKIGGSAVEGAIVTAPHVITEAALGDPEAAAETLIAGTGIGMLFGGAQGLGKEFLGLGKKVSSETARLVGETDLNARKIARRAAKVLTNVDEDDILYYMKNTDKVNAAPTMEALKDQIDDAVKQYSDNSVLLDEALKNTDRKLEDAYKMKRYELSRTRAPQELADELVMSLDNQKAVLGQMSEQADQILADSGAFLPKKKVIRMIEQIQEKVIPYQVGSKAKAASKNLDQLKFDIEDSFPSNIDGNELRSILRQVRDDIDFNQMAGQFNERGNRALKGFTDSISNALKKKVPDYEKIMDQMFKRSKSLEKMSKSFGDRERAANTLTGMLKPGKEVKRELLQEFSDLTGEDFFTRFDALAKDTELGRQIAKGVDLREQLLPALSREKQELTVQARNARELVEAFKSIGPNSSQAAIRNMGFKNPNIMTRRAFEKLEELTGTPFLDQIKDRNILDSFMKQSTQGSRKVNLGAITGLATGGGVEDALIGGLVGATADNYGGQILKSFMDRNPNMAGLIFVEKAMKKTADEIDRVPSILERMSRGTKEISKRTMAIDAIYRLTDSPKDKNTGEQLEEVGNKIRAWLSDPTQFEDMISKFTFPLAEGGAPNISQGLSIGAQKALTYLQEEIPKPPRPSSPFSKKIAWNPSDFETNRFAQILEVAENPFIVLSKLEDGSLSSNHVDALKRLFPPVYNALQQKIIDTAAENPGPLDYNDRVRLSILTEVPLDESLTDEQFLSLQKNFMQAQDEQPDMNEEEFSPKQDVKLAKANLTTMQQALM